MASRRKKNAAVVVAHDDDHALLTTADVDDVPTTNTGAAVVRRSHRGVRSPQSRTEEAAGAPVASHTGKRLPTASTKRSRSQSKAKVERSSRKKRALSTGSPPSRSKRRVGSDDDEVPQKRDGKSDTRGDDGDDSSQSESSEPEEEDYSPPRRKARTNSPRKRGSTGGGDGGGSSSSGSSSSGGDTDDDGSDFIPEGGEEGDGDDFSSSSSGTPRSPPPPTTQTSTRPNKRKKRDGVVSKAKANDTPVGEGSSPEPDTTSAKKVVKKPRNRPITRGNGAIPQPHLSVAYRSLEAARKRRSSAETDLLDARRRLEEARAAVRAAEIEIAEADAAVSRKGGEVVDAELRVRPSRWNEMYRRLAAYQLRHGHCLLSRRIPGATLSSAATGRGKGGGEDFEGEDDDPDLDELAKWVFNQRRYLKGKRGEAADVFGGFDANGEAIASGSGAEDNGATKKNTNGTTGGRWGKAYRIAALDRLGFVWEEEVEVKWTMNLRRLAQYGAEHGHCQVPQRYTPDMALGRWVNSQRVHYRRWREGKPTQMTDERYRKLREVGFVFQPDNAPRHRVEHPRRRQTAEEAWEEKFAEFAEFRAEHGHGHLNQDNGPKGHVELCRWATFQRKQFRLYREGRPSLLTREKVERLDSLGFYWSIKEARADLPHVGGKKKAVVEEGLPGRTGDGETDITNTGDRASSASKALPDEAPASG